MAEAGAPTTSYPTAIDTFPTRDATHLFAGVNTDDHLNAHAKTNAALLAIETETISLVAAAAGGQTINTQTADYTLVLTDAGDRVRMNKASAITLTVPANANVAFPIGTVITVEQVGAGALTVAAAGGVTVNGVSLVFRTQYSVAWLVKTAADTWELVGDVVPTPPTYTQTYSTAARTVSNITASAVTLTSVAPVTTGAGLTAYGYTQSQANAISLAVAALVTTDIPAIITENAQLAADHLMLQKVVTALIDDLQTLKVIA